MEFFWVPSAQLSGLNTMVKYTFIRKWQTLFCGVRRQHLEDINVKHIYL